MQQSTRGLSVPRLESSADIRSLDFGGFLIQLMAAHKRHLREVELTTTAGPLDMVEQPFPRPEHLEAPAAVGRVDPVTQGIAVTMSTSTVADKGDGRSERLVALLALVGGSCTLIIRGLVAGSSSGHSSAAGSNLPP